MKYTDAVAWLANHGNLAQGQDAESLLYALWDANRTGIPPDLTPLLTDVLSCLAMVNLELNGERPSETSNVRNPQVLPDVSYAVSGLIAGLLSEHRRWSSEQRFEPHVLEHVRDAALRVAMAWDMVLAGDHDALIEELELEWNAAV